MRLGLWFLLDTQATIPGVGYFRILSADPHVSDKRDVCQMGSKMPEVHVDENRTYMIFIRLFTYLIAFCIIMAFVLRIKTSHAISYCLGRMNEIG